MRYYHKTKHEAGKAMIVTKYSGTLIHGNIWAIETELYRTSRVNRIWYDL